MTDLITALALVAFVVAYPLWSALTWPRFVRDVRGGAPGLRVKAYVEVLLVQWSLTIVVLACWAVQGRPWPELGLAVPNVVAWFGLGGVAIVAVLSRVQLRAMRAAPDQAREQLQKQLGATLELLPKTRTEQRWFRAVAMTAGFCEEVIYRGALPFFLALAFGLPDLVAIAIATVAFGLGHAYQGPRSVVKVTMVGAVMALVTFATDSLWTAIALHALVDLNAGAVAQAAVGEDATAPE